jgi:hypothetical protein
VLKNSFNVLRGHVHALGKRAAPLALAARIGELERRHEALLQQLPPQVRASYAAQRSRAMAEPGSEKWRFPPRLMTAVEEATFRKEHADEEEEPPEEERSRNPHPQPHRPEDCSVPPTDGTVVSVGRKRQRVVGRS